MPLQSKLAEPVLPVEILEEILRLYFDTIYHDTSPSRRVSTEWPRSCAPSLVCKTFFEICRPLRLQVLSGLQIDAEPQTNAHLEGVASFFDNNPKCRRYVQDLNLYINEPVEKTHDLERNLKGLKFPAVKSVTFLMPERQGCIHRRLLEMFMAHYVATLKSVHRLELRGGSTTFIFPYLRIRGLREISLTMSAGLYISLHAGEAIPAVLSDITTFSFSGSRLYRSPVNSVPVALHALLLLPKLQALQLHGFDMLTPVDYYTNPGPAPSFDLQTLSLSAGTQNEIVGILDFYEEHARRASVDPFTRLQTLTIQVERGQYPTERVSQLLDCRMPLLQHLSLTWVHPSAGTSLEGIRNLYDKIVDIITSASSTLSELVLSVPSIPTISTYTLSMEAVTGFLTAVQHKNQLRMIRLDFIKEDPKRGNSPPSVECIYPAEPWAKIAELLKCADKFPRLETVIICFTKPPPQRTDRHSHANLDVLSNAVVTAHIQEAVSRLKSRKALNIIITHAHGPQV